MNPQHSPPSRGSGPGGPTRGRLQGLLAVLALPLIVLGCAAGREPASGPPVPEGTPRLVLYLVVDQMRADYLTRFAPLYHQGLKRLVDQSVMFSEAHQDHADTVTAVGHSTLSTGEFGAHHGIIGNGWFDVESGKEITAVVDADGVKSPRRMLRPTIGDLLKRQWPQSKVFSVGGKDRSNVFTAGFDADAAYWYDGRDGTFTTSSYYLTPLADRGPAPGRPDGTPGTSKPTTGGTAGPPDWMKAFHDRHLLDSLFGEVWEPLLPLEEVAPYGITPFDGGYLGTQFPHAIGGLAMEPDRAFYANIAGTPFLDAYVIDFAKALIDGEQLGQDAFPDFLGVTLSVLDAVGHELGPDAPETLDVLLRLDRKLAELLDFVDQRVGLDHVVIVLSSDHGVGEVPELLQQRGVDAARFGTEQIECFQRAGRELSRNYGLEGRKWMPEPFYFDRKVLSANQVDVEGLTKDLIQRVEQCPRIVKVFRPEQLDIADPGIEGKFARSYYQGRSPDLLVLLAPNTLTTRSMGASHGQAYEYDSHVPWLLRLPAGAGRRIDQPVRTVDVAPTLAELLGIASGDFDGVSRLGLAHGSESATPTAAAAGTVSP